MIPRDYVIEGIRSTPFVALLAEFEELKPPARLIQFLNFLAEIGILQKKGDKYKGGKSRLVEATSPIAQAVSDIFQNVVMPYLSLGRRAVRLSPETQRSLYIYTTIYQALRVAIVQEFLNPGGLAVVAGWFPCGFSSEIMSIAGRDLVVVEERDDLVAIEADRLSLLPLTSAPLQSELAPASFYAFEILNLGEVETLAEKYGKFNTAVVCDRHVDLSILRKIAGEVMYIVVRDRALANFNRLVLESLGLRPTSEENIKTVEKFDREKIGDFDIYFLR
ncbi:MAG: hypothetical protein QXK71_03285 [Pyrobaculum sp.]|jgi:hypothetical protein